MEYKTKSLYELMNDELQVLLYFASSSAEELLTPINVETKKKRNKKRKRMSGSKLVFFSIFVLIIKWGDRIGLI